MQSKELFILRLADLANLYDGQPCPICGHEMDAERIRPAFRIPPTPQNIEEYGESIIYHPVNYGLVAESKCATITAKNWNKPHLHREIVKRAEIWDRYDRERREDLKKLHSRKGNKFIRGDWRDQLRSKYGVDETEPQK